MGHKKLMTRLNFLRNLALLPLAMQAALLAKLTPKKSELESFLAIREPDESPKFAMYEKSAKLDAGSVEIIPPMMYPMGRAPVAWGSRTNGWSRGEGDSIS